MFVRVLCVSIMAMGFALGLSSCNSDGAGISTAPSAVGAAVGSLFSSSGEAATAYRVENDTCGEFEDEEGAVGGPEGVETAASVTAGTYGSTSDPVTVTAEDDCESEASEAYASFELTADVVGDCTGASVTMKAGSGGVFRNTEDYTPEIYGTFTFDVDGETYSDVKCTIRMNGEGTVVANVSSCVDSEGAAVSMDSSDTCTFGE